MDSSRIQALCDFFSGQEGLHRPPSSKSEGARMLMKASTGLLQILLWIFRFGYLFLPREKIDIITMKKETGLHS